MGVCRVVAGVACESARRQIASAMGTGYEALQRWLAWNRACRRAGCCLAVRKLRPAQRLITGTHAPFPVLPACPAGDAQGGGNRLPSAESAQWHDPPVERGHLFLVAAGLSGPQQD